MRSDTGSADFNELLPRLWRLSDESYRVAQKLVFEPRGQVPRPAALEEPPLMTADELVRSIYKLDGHQ